MKELYIHIGMGKTGTTALQEFFFENRELLRNRGIYYPELGVVSGAHHLLSPHHPKFIPDWDYIPVEVWKQELSKTNENKILISSELISSLPYEDVYNFIDKLVDSFIIKVVVYVRNPYDFVISAFAQQVKVGMQRRDFNHAFNKVIDKQNIVSLINSWRLDEHIEQLIVLPYEKNKFYKNNLIEDFLYRVLDIKLSSDFIVSNDVNVNPSIPVEFIPIKIFLNNIISDIYLSQNINKIIDEFCDKTKPNLSDISKVHFYSSEQQSVLKNITDEVNKALRNCNSGSGNVNDFIFDESKKYFNLTADLELSRRFFSYMKRYHHVIFEDLVKHKIGLANFNGDRDIERIFDAIAKKRFFCNESPFLSYFSRFCNSLRTK